MEDQIKAGEKNTAVKNLSKLAENYIPTDSAVSAIVNLQRSGKLDMATAIKGRQLSYYKRMDSEYNVAKVVSALILSIADSYNLKDRCTIDEAQSWDIARTIIRDFWYIKLAELYLFAEKAKSGEYGKVYDRLDRAVIIEWLKKFDEIKEDYLFLEMQGLNTTDDVPAEELNEAQIAQREEKQRRADVALQELASRLKLTNPCGNSLKEKLSDPRFRAHAMNYELNDPEQKKIREHNQKIEEELKKPNI